VLDLADVRKDPEKYRKGLARKGNTEGLEALLRLEAEQRALLFKVEALRAEQNAAGKEIAVRKKAGQAADEILGKMKDVKARETALGKELDGLQARLDAALRLLPNPPDDDVPDGTTSDDNRELSRKGDIPEFGFTPKPHWEIAAALGVFHPETAGKMSGSGFTLLTGEGALLERALGQFLLDLATRRHGYTEVSAPILMREEAMDTVTIREKFRDDMYLSEKDGLYLIPTAEHPLTNLHRDAILDGESLPRRYTALTPCFRREAGAAGRDTRGMLRVHQFWKVEMMSFAHPDRSREEHERMRGNAEAALEALGLPFRTVFVCTGDMSAANRRQYDLEVWAAGTGKWLEVSSVSNFGDWQARRCGTRCRSGKDKPRFVHTLNGSALGMPRVLVALLENNQRADGSVAVPPALRPWMGGREALGPPGKP